MLPERIVRRLRAACSCALASPIDRVIQDTEQLQGSPAYQDDVSMVEIEVR